MYLRQILTSREYHWPQMAMDLETKFPTLDLLSCRPVCDSRKVFASAYLIMLLQPRRKLRSFPPHLLMCGVAFYGLNTYDDISFQPDIIFTSEAMADYVDPDVHLDSPVSEKFIPPPYLI